MAMEPKSKSTHSLILRLALWHAVVGLGTLLLGGAILQDTLREVVWLEHRRGILAAAGEVRQRLEAEGVAGLRRPLPEAIAQRFDTASGTMMYAVIDARGRRLVSSPGAEQVLPRLAEDGTVQRDFQQGQDGSLVWGVTERIATPDGPMDLQVAQDMDRSYVVLDNVPAAALLPLLAVLGGGSVLIFLANVGLLLLLLRPLRRAAREAELIGHGGAPRLATARMPAEVLPLIEAVNGALDRLDDSLAWQRGFSAEVAHELRTPLAILLAELDLLDSGAVTERLKHDVEQLAQLVSSLLEAAAAARDQPLRDEVFDLVALADTSVRRFATLAEREGHALRVAAPAQPIWIRGEGDAMGRALRNLLENALAHSPPGAPIDLRVAAHEDGGAVIEVADHGTGVREADRASLFRRYWRAGSVRRRGLGLGLSIVERVVLAHGGTVDVHNAPEGGAVFTLRLPAPLDAVAAA
ncbi:sensor histidine kinase [Plastoroseomonas arctica]|uniref:histidine kinase n=1 Tax=Plastoroseomonas arctica TaxID=1509237 RepID=A0AAF1JWQ4_9PROT|nr:HAMP domain-containing sensor histidine kinase [Plastoroseomonas arctica]MBR0655447.1 HAMP domain-containing histidine kinase [Plastoroseomonas arctica]